LNLQEKVIALRKELYQKQQKVIAGKENTWRLQQIGATVHGEGVHLIECASKAAEELMHLDDRYMHVSAWQVIKHIKNIRMQLLCPFGQIKVHFMNICTPFLLHT